MDSKITVIIAEDNEDAQEIMMSFIEPLHHFEVIGVADNGDRLLDLNVNKKPHLILAGINMPKLNGIEAIAACLKTNPELKFIFTTGSEEHAVKAFDLNAVDYVLKPIKKERLYIALERAKASLDTYSEIEQKQILTIKIDRTSYFIHFPRIIFIEKHSRKTIIHTREQQYETNETLESIFKQLDHHFFRTHRSFIVNINYISHITIEGDTYFAHFINYSEYAHVSKLQKNELFKELSFDPENSK